MMWTVPMMNEAEAVLQAAGYAEQEAHEQVALYIEGWRGTGVEPETIDVCDGVQARRRADIIKERKQ